MRSHVLVIGSREKEEKEEKEEEEKKMTYRASLRELKINKPFLSCKRLPAGRETVNTTHHGQIKFKYKVVHHEKDLSNLKVDPLRVPKK